MIHRRSGTWLLWVRICCTDQCLRIEWCSLLLCWAIQLIWPLGRLSAILGFVSGGYVRSSVLKVQGGVFMSFGPSSYMKVVVLMTRWRELVHHRPIGRVLRFHESWWVKSLRDRWRMNKDLMTRSNIVARALEWGRLHVTVGTERKEWRTLLYCVIVESMVEGDAIAEIASMRLLIFIMNEVVSVEDTTTRPACRIRIPMETDKSRSVIWVAIGLTLNCKVWCSILSMCPIVLRIRCISILRKSRLTNKLRNFVLAMMLFIMSGQCTGAISRGVITSMRFRKNLRR